jgi:hypothetical protein
MGGGSLERGEPILGFFDTLQSRLGDGFAQRQVQAHERRLRGNTRPRPEGRNPQRGKGQERIDRRVPGNTGSL